MGVASLFGDSDDFPAPAPPMHSQPPSQKPRVISRSQPFSGVANLFGDSDDFPFPAPPMRSQSPSQPRGTSRSQPFRRADSPSPGFSMFYDDASCSPEPWMYGGGVCPSDGKNCA